MGNKFILELPDGCDIGRVDGGVKLTPYTEPDTEKVKEEAYTEAKIDAGQEYENGYDAGHNVGYQQGLSDAWEAARKIANMPYDEEEKAFGSGGWAFIEKHTASEAIEKIRQYEQEQEDDHDRKKVVALADDIGIHKLYALVREIRGE